MSTPTDDRAGATPAPGRDRPLDLFSLVAGIAVAAGTVAMAVGDLSTVADGARYAWPLLLLAAGIGLLVTARRRESP